MECKVQSATPPTTKWSKDGCAITNNSTFQDIFTNLGNNIYLCQLEIKVNEKKNFYFV